MAFSIVKNGDGLGRERLVVWDGVGSLPTTYKGAAIDADMPAVDTSSAGDRYVFDGTQWIQTASGGAPRVSVSAGVVFTPSSYTGNVEVNSITGMALATTATDAKVIRLTVASVTGSPGALYVAFGTDSADAIGNVNATSGSEAGMLLSLTPADGDTYEITIPANAQDGGVLAAGITGYVDTTNELVLNVTQGV